MNKVDMINALILDVTALKGPIKSLKNRLNFKTNNLKRHEDKIRDMYAEGNTSEEFSSNGMYLRMTASVIKNLKKDINSLQISLDHLENTMSRSSKAICRLRECEDTQENLNEVFSKYLKGI